MAICNKCGMQVDDNVTFCPNCGNQMSGSSQFQGGPDLNKQQQTPPPPPPQYNQNGAYNQQYNSYQQQPQVSMTGMLVWAILNTICCCLPFGIVAIVMAVRIKDAMSYEEAKMAYDRAKKWNLAATIVGAVALIILVILYAVGIFTLINGGYYYNYWY